MIKLPDFTDRAQAIKFLRLTALAGVLLAMLVKIFSVSDIKTNEAYSFYALLLVGGIAGGALLILRRATLKV